jgi:hypothetical protein
MYIVDIILEAHGTIPLTIPLDDPPLPGKSLPCSRIPLTYLESLLCMWCDSHPLRSQVAYILTSPSPFPSSFPAPQWFPQFNYVPFYDDITTSTSHSLIQYHCSTYLNDKVMSLFSINKLVKSIATSRPYRCSPGSLSGHYSMSHPHKCQ